MEENDWERKELERGRKIFYGILGVIFLIVSGTLIIGHFQRQYLKNNPKSVIRTEENPIDNIKIHTLLLPSEYSLERNFNNDADLYFRCYGSKPDVFLTTNRFMNDGSVRLKWDGGKVDNFGWGIGDKDNYLFSRFPKEFVAQVLNHKNLIIGFTPYSSTEQFAEFNLDDDKGIGTISFKDDLRTMKSYCF